MKNLNRLICLFLPVIIFFNMALPVQAHDKEGHNEEMRDALFKACFKDMSFYRHFSKEDAEKAIEALECAAYLAIDQFNGGGKEELKQLKEYGVKGLPDSITEINFTSNQYHRKYTHRGWDAEDKGIYQGDVLKRWIIRKQILTNTADKIFGSKLNSEKKNSFCAIVYYIHLLGDRESGDTYYTNAVIMELGGRKDNYDIISELIKHIKMLFSFSLKRMFLIDKLQEINSEVAELRKAPDGSEAKIEEELFNQYKKYASLILKDKLTLNLPKMLKDEQWFSDVFYSA